MFVPFVIVALVILLLAGRLLFRLALRLAVTLCLAGVAGTALSLALGQGAWIAALFAILLILPVALLLRAARRGRRVRRSIEANPAGTRSPWEALRRAVPRERQRLETAEARCDAFLRLADAGDFRPETAELQVLVARRVPELIAHGLARAQAAAPAERRQVLDATVASVLEAAAAAETEYAALWQASGNRFAAQRAHLANRLRPGPLSSI